MAIRKGVVKPPSTNFAIPLRACRRSFLLLEVLIAFALIALCVIPLVSPHVYILMEQKKFIKKIELDHLVNLVYADIVERLYRNQISWNAIINGEEFEVDEALLERIQFGKGLPYKGTYRFKENKHKPEEEAALRKIYLLELHLFFVPIEEENKALHYEYELLAIRDLSSSQKEEEK